MKNPTLYTDLLCSIERELDCPLNEEWSEKMDDCFAEWIQKHGLSDHSIEQFVYFFDGMINEYEAFFMSQSKGD